jgi:hypothetical protein
MQMVKEIDEEDKEKIDRCLKGEGMVFRSEFDLLTRIVLAVFHGKTLPKNHGQLVDYDAMKKRAGDFGMYAEAIVSHFKPQVIVEAESVEE